MPKISERGERMPASPIRKLVPLANEATARGTKVIRLNIGQPDLPTPQEGLDALKKIDRTVLEYSPSEGLLSLRKKLADYYHRFNIDVDVDDIIVTTGGSEAVLRFHVVPQPRRRNYRPRTRLRQLHGIRHLRRSQNRNRPFVDRGGICPSSRGELRETDHPQDKRHTYMQSQ